MMECTSNRSIAAQTGEAVLDNADLRRIVSQLKHAATRTGEMAMPECLAALNKALGTDERPTQTCQGPQETAPAKRFPHRHRPAPAASSLSGFSNAGHSQHALKSCSMARIEKP